VVDATGNSLGAKKNEYKFDAIHRSMPARKPELIFMSLGSS
jgi:hypothetical protein